MKIPFKTAYQSHDRHIFVTIGPSLAHQSMAGETDINRIMSKFEKTGVLEHRNTFEGKYGDFTDSPMDYHESMNAVIRANDMFDTLPSKIRRRFGNDAGQFLDFVSDESNSAEMVKLGLAKAPPPELFDEMDHPLPKSKPPVKKAPTDPSSKKSSERSSSET